jgi:hypothetical protein
LGENLAVLSFVVPAGLGLRRAGNKSLPGPGKADRLGRRPIPSLGDANSNSRRHVTLSRARVAPCHFQFHSVLHRYSFPHPYPHYHSHSHSHSHPPLPPSPSPRPSCSRKLRQGPVRKDHPARTRPSYEDAPPGAESSFRSTTACALENLVTQGVVSCPWPS